MASDHLLPDKRIQLASGNLGPMRSKQFRVPINRDIPMVDDAEWEAAESATQRLGVTMARLRLLANADTVRVVVNGNGEEGLLRRSVDYEMQRRRGLGFVSRARVWISDLFWLNAPDSWRSRPWEQRGE
jgi:hypothetical protein